MISDARQCIIAKYGVLCGKLFPNSSKGVRIIMLSERDYQYYGCYIKNYMLDEEKKILILSCDYLGRPFINLVFHDVRTYDSLVFLSNHIINHMTCVYDMDSDVKLFEIHFDQLFEVTKVWATKMLPVSNLSGSTNS